MKQDIVDQSLPSHLRTRRGGKVFLRLMAIALLLSLTHGSYLALNYLVPRGSGRAQEVTERVNWYVQSGQSRADARTLVSMFRFMMETESDAGDFENYSNMPIAKNASTSSLKS